MAAAGLYTFGGSFWEFGEPDWEHTKYFMMFGVAEDHGSNPIKTALGKLKGKGVKFVAVNPVRSGYGAIADEWIGIRPGTDGMFIAALIRELLINEKIDLQSLVTYTNAPWLVIQDEGAADHGLFARNEDGKPLCVDKASGEVVDATRIDISPSLVGEVELADGRKAVPSFQLIADRFLRASITVLRKPKKSPGCRRPRSAVLLPSWLKAAFENEVVLDVPWTDWAGRRHEKMVGRPVSFARDARDLGAFQWISNLPDAAPVLQILLGTIDCPGGFRYKAPFPKPDAAATQASLVKPGTSPARTRPLGGPPLGFTTGPEDLLIDRRRQSRCASTRPILGMRPSPPTA